MLSSGLQMKVFSSILACLFVFSCTYTNDFNGTDANGTVPEIALPELENELSLSQREYAVLSAIVKTNTLVVVNLTKDNYLGKLSPKTERYPGMLAEVVDDYNRKNATQVPVDCRFVDITSCTLLTAANLKSLWDFRGENATEKWRNFKVKYRTDRYHTLSRVGFSKDGSQALAFVTSTCGTLCADGSYYFLVLDNGTWKVSKQATAWVS